VKRFEAEAVDYCINIKGLPHQKKKYLKFIRKEKPKNTKKPVGRFCKNKTRKPEPESNNEDEPEAVSSSEDMCTGCEELCATTEQNCD
jgi:hypothetical protein